MDDLIQRLYAADNDNVLLCCEAAKALEAANSRIADLESQLLAKTELATLYAASLRQSEKEVDELKAENQRIRLEFRADCEKHAEELFKVQGDVERLAWWFRFDPPKDNDFIDVYLKGMAERWNLNQWMAAIDAARLQGKEG